MVLPYRKEHIFLLAGKKAVRTVEYAQGRISYSTSERN